MDISVYDLRVFMRFSFISAVTCYVFRFCCAMFYTEINHFIFIRCTLSVNLIFDIYVTGRGMNALELLHQSCISSFLNLPYIVFVGVGFIHSVVRLNDRSMVSSKTSSPQSAI
jgi:hypothetical protein